MVRFSADAKRGDVGYLELIVAMLNLYLTEHHANHLTNTRTN